MLNNTLGFLFNLGNSVRNLPRNVMNTALSGLSNLTSNDVPKSGTSLLQSLSMQPPPTNDSSFAQRLQDKKDMRNAALLSNIKANSFSTNNLGNPTSIVRGDNSGATQASQPKSSGLLSKLLFF